MNIQGPRLNFLKCESFLESNFPDIIALCEANLDDSVDSGNLSVRGYLPLIRKDPSTHMLSEGKTSFCTRFISRKLCRFADVFDWHYFTQCLTPFSLPITFFIFMHGF